MGYDSDFRDGLDLGGDSTRETVPLPSKFSHVRPEKNRIFSKRAKIVISVKNLKFILWISDDEMDFTVGIVLRNLATTSNFVEFRDRQSWHVFRGIAFRVP